MPAPPVFLSFGMPPASIPASCGGAPPPAPVSPPSLLLLALFGAGGARPGGAGGAPPGLAMPGMGGAPMTGAAALSFLSSTGADLSLTTPTFFSLVPDSMLLSNAPCFSLAACDCCPHDAYSASSFCLLLAGQSTGRRRSRWRRRATTSSTHPRQRRRRRRSRHRDVCGCLMERIE